MLCVGKESLPHIDCENLWRFIRIYENAAVCLIFFRVKTRKTFYVSGICIYAFILSVSFQNRASPTVNITGLTYLMPIYRCCMRCGLCKKGFLSRINFLEDVPFFGDVLCVPFFRGRLFSPRHLKYALLKINVYFSQLMTIIYLLFL